MNYLHIEGWLASVSFYGHSFHHKTLHQQLLVSCALEEAALSQLESRIQACYPVAIPLRPKIDPSTRAASFAAAGGITREVRT